MSQKTAIPLIFNTGPSELSTVKNFKDEFSRKAGAQRVISLESKTNSLLDWPDNRARAMYAAYGSSPNLPRFQNILSLPNEKRQKKKKWTEIKGQGEK